MRGEAANVRGRFRSAAALLACLPVLAVPACAGSPDDGDVREVAATFLTAMADADGEALCSTLSDSELARVELAFEAAGEAGDCSAAVDEGGKQFEDYVAGLRERAEKIDDAELVVEDGAATVTFPVGDADSGSASAGPRGLFLIDQDGEWKVDDQLP